MSRRIRLGTRGSALALVQTAMVEVELLARGEWTETVVIQTEGDQSTQPLRQMEGKGFFTKELDEALLNGRVDLAVHSLKDLPTDLPEGISLRAHLRRAFALDVLLARRGVLGFEAGEPVLRPQAVVGTTSLRRQAQIRAAFPDASPCDVRGNVPTRVQKLRAGDFDALVLAQAGLDRLELELSDLDCLALEPPRFLPAPGQGAVAVTARTEDRALEEILRKLNHEPTERVVAAERTVLAGLEGGCHLPLGTLAVITPEGGLHLRASLATKHGMVLAEAEGETPHEVAESVLAELRSHRVGRNECTSS